jgi:hypothetical protein
MVFICTERANDMRPTSGSPSVASSLVNSAICATAVSTNSHATSKSTTTSPATPTPTPTSTATPATTPTTTPAVASTLSTTTQHGSGGATGIERTFTCFLQHLRASSASVLEMTFAYNPVTLAPPQTARPKVLLQTHTRSIDRSLHVGSQWYGTDCNEMRR